MKDQALKDIEMYFGKPPYESEHVRHHLMKYGLTPIELMKKLRVIKLGKKAKQEALKDLKMYFGEPPVKKETVRKRVSSGLLEMQILAKYLMTVDELMREVGFEVIK